MRADFCPVANHPCAAGCEKPCSFSDGGIATQLQQALDMLCGLAGEVSTDDPMTAAERIFDHVQAERSAHTQELKNYQRNLEVRDSFIASLRATMQQAQAPGWQWVPVELLRNAIDDANTCLEHHLQAYGETYKPERAAYYREQIKIMESLLAAAPQGDKT